MDLTAVDCSIISLLLAILLGGYFIDQVSRVFLALLQMGIPMKCSEPIKLLQGMCCDSVRLSPILLGIPLAPSQGKDELVEAKLMP